MAARDTSAARAARAAKRAGEPTPPRTPQAARSRGAVNVGVLLLLVGAVVLLYLAFRGASNRLVPNLAGLVPWRGGTGWRVRGGQYINPAAMESLLAVGEEVSASCNPTPMTLDISRAEGGVYPPHVSHQTGRDVDVRMSDLSRDCRLAVQAAFTKRGWQTWYDGPDAVAPTSGGRHISHLHARYLGASS